ncbi:Gamma-taxilin [Fukomys damarensis]|uniref:Gamma-taxilin n=1 Tax=Fukomys damarensis TaxID=885580 RepID=A0A091DVS9_FUKDA|nr:Gamma-taxilin [Fukomys damarensis]
MENAGLMAKADMLGNSQSNDILQHQDFCCCGTTNNLSLEDDGSNCIAKKRNVVSPDYCVQELSEDNPQQSGLTTFLYLYSQKELECNRIKGKTLEKEVVLLMQALNTLSTPEEKLATLCKKYADLEENMQLAKEGEESRTEAAVHFQITLNKIQSQLKQHDIHNSKLQQENIELGEKLKKFVEQYALREEHIDKVLKQKELEQQLVNAKLQQTTQMIKEANEKHHKEREFLLKELTKSKQNFEEMKQQEVQLKQQLSVYMDKFEEFQATMAKSNELFKTFKQEMAKMTRKIKEREKEMTVWRTKWENNNKILLQMAEEKNFCDKEFRAFHIKLDRLEKMFRALQMERNELTEKVKIMKEQVFVKATDKDISLPVPQSGIVLDSHKLSDTSFESVSGVPLEAESKALNERKCHSKDPFHKMSSRH